MCGSFTKGSVWWFPGSENIVFQWHFDFSPLFPMLPFMSTSPSSFCGIKSMSLSLLLAGRWSFVVHWSSSRCWDRDREAKAKHRPVIIVMWHNQKVEEQQDQKQHQLKASYISYSGVQGLAKNSGNTRTIWNLISRDSKVSFSVRLVISCLDFIFAGTEAGVRRDFI